MFEKLEVMQMARALASHASARQSVVAQNIANADTPGYRARDIADFAGTYRSATDDLSIKTTRPGHFDDPAARALYRPFEDMRSEVSPNGNSVSLEDQIIKSAEVRHQHDKALAIYKSSLDIIRASIGRGR